MKKKRQFSPFNLAPRYHVMWFAIIKQTNIQVEQQNSDLMSEVNLLQQEVRQGEENLVKANNTLSKVDMELAEAEGLATRIRQQLKQSQNKQELLEQQNPQQVITRLADELAKLEAEKKQLEQEIQQAEDNRRIEAKDSANTSPVCK